MSLADTFDRLKNVRGIKLHGMPETRAGADSDSDSKNSTPRQGEPHPAASPAPTPPREAGRVLKGSEVRVQGSEKRKPTASVTEPRTPNPEPSGEPRTPNSEPSGDEVRRRREALEEHEKRIRRHRKSWIDCGQSLAAIHREQLYLDQTFTCFEDYVEARHPWTSPRQAWNYIRAAQVAENVKAINHQLGLHAAVALSRLKPADRQPECLSRLIAEHGKSPTAKAVAEAVARLLGKPKKKRRKQRPVHSVRVAPGKVVTIAANWPIDDLRSILKLVQAQLDTTPQPQP